jgi:hypothetical protein
LSPFTDIAISCVTDDPLPAALLTAAFASGLRVACAVNGAGPMPRTMNVPLP